MYRQTVIAFTFLGTEGKEVEAEVFLEVQLVAEAVSGTKAGAQARALAGAQGVTRAHLTSGRL